MTVSPISPAARTATAGTREPTMADLIATMDELADRVLDLSARLDEVVGQVETLAAKPARVRGALSALDERVLEVVRSTPLRVTALTIGESIGEDNTKVGSSLAKLAGQGLILSEKRDNRTRTYFRREDPAT